jgi:uncharacterized protein
MKYTTLMLFLLTSVPLFSQIKMDEIASKKLNATRKLRILTPPSFGQDKNKKYPLLLVLDGEYLVDPFAGNLEYGYYWDEMPETIIVGVEMNGDDEQRLNDVQTSDTGVPVGTGDKFFQFIGDELLPYLDKKYPLSPFRIIAGHDMTARMANFFIYKEKSPFRGYICFSPDMALEMENRIPEMLAKVNEPTFFYVCSAEGDIKRLRENIKKLNDNMKTVKNTNLNYMYDEFTGGSHYSIVPMGAPAALYGIYNSYKPISPIEYQEKIVTLPSGYVDYLVKKYSIIENDLGTKMTIRLNDFKAIEAAILKNAVYDELKDLSKLAKANYPKTIIGEYYEGLFYEMTGDYKKAKKVYLNAYAYDAVGEYTKEFIVEKSEKM